MSKNLTAGIFVSLLSEMELPPQEKSSLCQRLDAVGTSLNKF